MEPTLIALDMGNGNTQACSTLGGPVSTIQSSVSRAHNDAAGEGQPTAGKRKPARVTTDGERGLKIAGREAKRVEFEDGVYFTGPGAWHRGDARDVILGEGLYHTPERKALMYTVLAPLLKPSTEPAAQPVALVIGLPTNLNEAQMQATKAGLATLKGDHRFTFNGAAYAFTVPAAKGSIRTLLQPMGAYFRYRYADDLSARAGRGGRTFVMDIGMGTFCTFAVQENLASGHAEVEELRNYRIGVERGVFWLLRAVAEARGVDLAEVDADLRAGRLVVKDGELASWINELMNTLRDRSINLKQFDAVLPVGGGALVLGDRWRNSLLARQAAVVDTDPLNDNVRGYLVYGLLAEREKRAQAA